MEEVQEIKRIVIIGGMGPQASIHAHSQLQKLLLKSGKNAEIVHISLVVKPFFNSEPALNLTERQKTLLGSIEAEFGFIACNTAHILFDQISELLNFELCSMIDFEKNADTLMVCSPSSKSSKVFGTMVNYLNDNLNRLSGEVISLVNQGNQKDALKMFKLLVNKLPANREVIISCTELSMLADKLNLNFRCTLNETLEKIVQDV